MKATTVSDVMTKSVVTVREDTPFKELVTTMHHHNVSGVPVLDAEGRLAGIVSEVDLLIAEEEELDPRPRSAFLEWFIHPARLAEIEKRGDDLRARDLMTRAVVTIDADAPVHLAIRRMLQEGVKRLPVVDAEDRVVGIVSRRDLLRPFMRRDEDIRDEIVDEVIQRTMWIDSTTIDVEVTHGVALLRGQVERSSEKQIMGALTRRVDGVVGVIDELTFRTDDRGLRAEPAAPELGWGENWVRSR